MKPATIIILASLLLIAVAFAFRERKNKSESGYVRVIIYREFMHHHFLCSLLHTIISFSARRKHNTGKYVANVCFCSNVWPHSRYFGRLCLWYDKIDLRSLYYSLGTIFLNYPPLSFGALGLAGLYSKKYSISCRSEELPDF